jgi:copper chaperone
MKVVLSVPDMSCGHCVGRIREALGEIGIDCEVDLAAKTVSVESEREAEARVKLESIDYPAQ